MNRRGRPLRFLTVVLAGWTGLRVAVLWPNVESPRDLIRAVVPIAEAARPARLATVVPRQPLGSSSHRDAGVIPYRRHVAPSPGPRRGDDRGSTGPEGDYQPRPTVASPQTFGAPALPDRPVSPATGRSPWFASAWILGRKGGGAAASGGPLLGGGQAGLRIGYSLTPRVAIVGRVSSPLQGRGREAALGVEWQPTRLPIRLVAEERFALDKGGGGMAPVIGAIGGFGPSPMAAGFRLEAYAQAGAIRRNGVSGFVDAQARATRPVADIAGLRIDVGAGIWASAQRGAARFDVGPTAGLAVPIGGRTVRLSLDWRERVAGDARPGSGPALTLGADF